jgi:hypothetical protein
VVREERRAHRSDELLQLRVLPQEAPRFHLERHLGELLGLGDEPLRALKELVRGP